VGPVQPLDAAQLQALNQRLAAAIGQPTDVAEVRQVGEGGNNGTHFVAIQNCGPHIGLKASDRVADGSAKERLVADVALALAVPNACRAVGIAVPEIPVLQGRNVNAIVWLENSAKLASLQAAEVQRIRANPQEYLYQYGQWMALALLLGVRDRHTQNWVWSEGSNRLAMIDNEDCLQPQVIQDFSPGIDLVADRAALRAAGSAVEPARSLAAGLELIQERFHAQRQQFDGILAGFAFAAGYNSQFMGLTGAQVVQFVFANLA
jgi:hypothetical protein